MRLRRMASLSLLLLAAAAAPQSPCGRGVNNGSIGQSESAATPRNPGFPAFLSASEGACDGSAGDPTEMQRMRPEKELEDAMHRLPPSESARPIGQPGQAPVYR